MPEEPKKIYPMRPEFAARVREMEREEAKKTEHIIVRDSGSCDKYERYRPGYDWHHYPDWLIHAAKCFRIMDRFECAEVGITDESKRSSRFYPASEDRDDHPFTDTFFRDRFPGLFDHEFSFLVDGEEYFVCEPYKDIYPIARSFAEKLGIELVSHEGERRGCEYIYEFRQARRDPGIVDVVEGSAQPPVSNDTDDAKDAVLDYLWSLHEGDRVVDAGQSGQTGFLGTVYIKDDDGRPSVCVKWDPMMDGGRHGKGQMTTSATWGTRRLCDVQFKGLWWCIPHNREATHYEREKGFQCDPNFGGITCPCQVEFRPNVNIYAPRPKAPDATPTT